MLMRRILFFALLLGAWIHSAGACIEEKAHVISPAAQEAMELAVPAVSEGHAVIGDEHRCECLAMMQDAQSVVSESSKSLLASYEEGAGALPNSPNPASVALAVHARAFSFIAHRAAPPPYLLNPRLRQ